MDHRIGAGALVFRGDELLLVNHKKENAYDFWVAPGGGAIDAEALPDAARREVKEETGLDVEIGKLLYIEEFWKPSTRECKFWYHAIYKGGELDATAEEATREYIIDAQFVARNKLNDMTVFPPVVKNRLWDDLERGFSEPVYLGIRAMEFY